MSNRLRQQDAFELVMNLKKGWSILRSVPLGVSPITGQTYRQILIDHGELNNPTTKANKYVPVSPSTTSSVGVCKCGCGQPTTRLKYDDKIRGRKAGEFKDFVHGHWTKLQKSKNPRYGNKYARIRNREIIRAKLVQAVTENPKLTIQDLRISIAPDYNNWAISRMLNVARSYADEGAVVSGYDPNGKRVAFLATGIVPVIDKIPRIMPARFGIVHPLKYLAKRTCYPKQFRLKTVVCGPISDVYPFISYGDTTDDLVMQVHALVPVALPEIDRRDICQNILEAIVSGTETIETVKRKVETFIRLHFRQFTKYGAISLDAPLIDGDGNGNRWHDVIADEKPISKPWWREYDPFFDAEDESCLTLIPGRKGKPLVVARLPIEKGHPMWHSGDV